MKSVRSVRRSKTSRLFSRYVTLERILTMTRDIILYKRTTAVWINIWNKLELSYPTEYVKLFIRDNVRRHYLVVVLEGKTTRALDNNLSVRAHCQVENAQHVGWVSQSHISLYGSGLSQPVGCVEQRSAAQTCVKYVLNSESLTRIA